MFSRVQYDTALQDLILESLSHEASSLELLCRQIRLDGKHPVFEDLQSAAGVLLETGYINQRPDGAYELLVSD